MTPDILDADYATRIRNRMGVQESHLSTDEIDEILPEIEADYKEWVPTYASKTGDDLLRLKSSIVCMAASRLCKVVKAKFPTREQGPGGSFETPIDWDLREQELLTEANRLLSKVVPPSVPCHFRIF